MPAQEAWLDAELRYVWMPWYYLILLALGVATAVGVYGLEPADYGWGVMAGAPVALAMLLAVVFYYFLLHPLRCQVTFERGHVFYRGEGVRGSRNIRAAYVKPSRVVRAGLEVSVRSNMRGFRIRFQSDDDATLFVDWCRSEGVPVPQPALG